MKMLSGTNPTATFFDKPTSSNISFDTNTATTVPPSNITAQQLQQQLDTLQVQLGQQQQINTFCEMQLNLTQQQFQQNIQQHQQQQHDTNNIIFPATPNFLPFQHDQDATNTPPQNIQTTHVTPTHGSASTLYHHLRNQH